MKNISEFDKKYVSDLNKYVSDLLHIDDVNSNKLIDLNADAGRNTFYLDARENGASSLADDVMRILLSRRGKPGNTALDGSSLRPEAEQRLGGGNHFGWHEGNESYDRENSPRRLDSFIKKAYEAIRKLGNNPVYLTVGAVEWRISVNGVGQQESRIVNTPLLIFPIRLIRGGDLAPVCIEFVDDDAHFNPCLYNRLRREHGDDVANHFPCPGDMEDADAALDLSCFGEDERTYGYFAQVERYAEDLMRDASATTEFKFNKDVVAIVACNHNEMCMYYDIRRNFDRIVRSELVQRAFQKGVAPESPSRCKRVAPLVLAADSKQQEMIERVLDGESMIIKGPPGTGKTLTIANMIAALLSGGKKVLFASEKLSALSEVYAKLPEKLRKFVLLLEGETTTQAADIKRETIVAELKKVWDKKREFALPDNTKREYAEVESEIEKEYKFLTEYATAMFLVKGALGLNLYDILDNSMKNAHLPYAEVTGSPSSLTAVQPELYNDTRSLVSSMDAVFDTLTGRGAHLIENSPWYGIMPTTDVDAALRDNTTLATDAKELLSVIDGKLRYFPGLSLDEISLSAVKWLLANEARKGEMAAAAEAVDVARRNRSGICCEVSDAYKAYVKAKAAVPGRFTYKEEGSAARLRETLIAEELGDGMPVATALDMYKYERLFRGVRGTGITDSEAKKLLGFIDLLDENSEKAGALGVEVRKAFSEEEERRCGVTLSVAAAKLAPYFETGAVKPKLFDFSAKSLFKKLAAASYIKGISFAAVTEAVQAYAKIKALEEEKVLILNQLAQCFGNELNDNEKKCLSFVLKYCREKEASVKEFVRKVADARPALTAAVEAFSEKPEDVTVGGLISALLAEAAQDRLQAALVRLNGVYDTFKVGARADAPRMGEEVNALIELCSVPYFEFKDKDDVAEVLAALRAPEAADVIERMAAKAKGARKHFLNRYTLLPIDGCTLGDWRIFAQEAGDRNVLGAMQRYMAVREGKNPPFDLKRFFGAFEKDKTRPGGFGDIFEHSFFRTLGNRMLNMLRGKGLDRNGLGNSVTKALISYGEEKKRLAELQASLIEKACFDGISDPDAQMFRFLHAGRLVVAQDNVRRLFKDNATGIMSLARCLILSPPSASLLFRQDDYADFDVVIVDEASQMKPVALLPLLFRAKQCVIVGDEDQMPPIVFFSARGSNDTTPDGDEDSSYDFCKSALSLALENERFLVRELVCHYRSATESLIAFSQGRFYPNMRTFPAVVPRKEGKLGFASVYVADAEFKDNINEKEATVVIQCLKKHFGSFYDDETGKLRKSVGVVAFNQKQVDYIERRIESSEQELYHKMIRACHVSGDVPEKTVFFKTVLTVQGQEADHLILAMTYVTPGRFGELNKSSYGINIFNVAVTRAREQLTLVHSIRACDITNQRLDFLKEYMELAERFGEERGASQFEHDDVGDGFVRNVADALEKCGIAHDRIVTGYGVTKGSVRIPIVVLSEDKNRALFGIMCETDVGKKYHYSDYNVLYRDILEERGWKLYRLNIADWFDRESDMPSAMEEFVRENLGETL